MRSRIFVPLVSTYPLLITTACLACGQAAATLFETYALLVALISLFLATLVYRKARTVCLALSSFSIGILSVAAILPEPVHELGSQVILYNIHDLRYPQPGRVIFTADALRSFSSLDTTNIQTSPTRIRCSALDLPWRNTSEALESSYVAAEISYSPLQRTQNPFSYSAMQEREGIVGSCKVRLISQGVSQTSSLIERARLRLIEVIERESSSTLAAGLLLSVVWGMEDKLPELHERAVREVGLAHLLVVSGAQLVFIYALTATAVRKILSLLRCSERFVRSSVYLCAFSLVGIFLMLSGFQLPAIRALVALLLTELSAYAGYPLRAGNKLLATALLMMVLLPGSLCTLSMQLTFAALVGLNLGYGNALRTFMTTHWYTWVATSFITVVWLAKFTVIALIVNPLSVSAISFIGTICGIIGTVLALLDVPGGALVLHLTGTLLVWWLEQMTAIYAWAGASTTLTPGEVCGVGSLLLLMLLRRITIRIRARIQGLPRRVEA